MYRMFWNRTAAMAVAASLLLASAAPALAAGGREERTRSRRQLAGHRLPETGITGQVIGWIRAVFGAEGGLIDPNGAPVPSSGNSGGSGQGTLCAGPESSPRSSEI